MARTFVGLMALVLTVSACGNDDPQSGPADVPEPSTQPLLEPEPEQTVEAISLYKLDCGTIEVEDLDIFSTEGDYAGQSAVFGNGCFLIRHPDGDLLWDLGLPTFLAGRPAQENGGFVVSLDFTLTDQLIELGLFASDIEFIAISHSLFDHAGQADQFLEATWLVHADEHAVMFPEVEEAGNGDGDEGAIPDAFPDFVNLTTEIFDGERDVFGDGTVTIIPAPGPTPGHTVLRVDLAETGPVLLTGDLYHRTESRALGRIPRFNSDEDQTRASMQMFEALADQIGAQVIIQHELADLDSLPNPPEALR